MKHSNVKSAIAEAERFLKRAKKLIPDDYGKVSTGENAAACKRASLDLTKALAKMRREI